MRSKAVSSSADKGIEKIYTEGDMLVTLDTRIKGCLFLATWSILLSGSSVAGDGGITIQSAKYGDLQQMKTCSPDLSICDGRSLCEFMIDDGLCTVPTGAGSARNLEVFFACGTAQAKGLAGAKGTRITMKCP
jgi:hypothetical protein